MTKDTNYQVQRYSLNVNGGPRPTPVTSDDLGTILTNDYFGRRDETHDEDGDDATDLPDKFDPRGR